MAMSEAGTCGGVFWGGVFCEADPVVDGTAFCALCGLSGAVGAVFWAVAARALSRSCRRESRTKARRAAGDVPFSGGLESGCALRRRSAGYREKRRDGHDRRRADTE